MTKFDQVIEQYTKKVQEKELKTETNIFNCKPENREQIINFCVAATAFLNDVNKNNVSRTEFSTLTDNELEQKANWLDDKVKRFLG
jgi:hypothetical protein